MDKPTLLKKVEELLDEADRTGMWGSIEIEFQYGKPTLLRQRRNTKLQNGGNTREYRRDDR